MTCTVDHVHTAMRTLRMAVPAYHPEINDETVALWHATLAHYPPALLADAAVAWGRTESHFPSQSEFAAAVRALERRLLVDREVERRARALPPAPAEDRRAHVAALRAQLRAG